MSSQTNRLSEDQYVEVLSAIDELQNIVRHVQAGKVLDKARFHTRIAAILRQLVNLVEVATLSSVFILYLGDICLEVDPVDPIVFAGIAGPNLLERVGQGVVDNCTEQMRLFYGKACWRHVSSLQRRALPHLPDAELPPSLPQLNPELQAYAELHNLQLLPLLCSICDAYEALGPPRGNEGYWGRLEENSELFSYHIPRRLLELSDTQIMKAKFKNAFWDMMHPNHEPWSVFHFVGVLKLDPVLDDDSRMVYGGPNGVRLFVVTCLRIFYAVYHAETTQSSQLAIARAVAPAFVLDYLLSAVTILHNEITRSAKLLRAARAKFVDQEFAFLDVSDDQSAERIESQGADERMKSPSPPRVEESSNVQGNATHIPALEGVVGLAQRAAEVMAGGHDGEQGSSTLQARSRPLPTSLPSAPESVVDVPSTVSSWSSDAEVEEDRTEANQTATASGEANTDEPLALPESEDEQQPGNQQQDQQKRPAKRSARSSDPPPADEPASGAQAGKSAKGKGKASPTEPPSSKRARRGSTASEPIQLDSESEDGLETIEPDTQANSSNALPADNDDFWNEVRRMTAKKGGVLATSTPNPGPSRQRAAFDEPAPEPGPSTQSAPRGRGRGKPAPADPPVNRGGKKCGGAKAGVGKGKSRK